MVTRGWLLLAVLASPFQASGKVIKETLILEEYVVDFLRPTVDRQDSAGIIPFRHPAARQKPFDIPDAQRSVKYLINGSYPGPTLRAMENDTFEITLVNNLFRAASTRGPSSASTSTSREGRPRPRPPPPSTPRVPQEAVPLEPHAAAHPLARDRGRGGLLHHPQFGHQGPDLLEPDGPPAADRAMVFRPEHGRASAALGRAEDASLHVKARRPPSLSSRRVSARLGPRARADCRRTFPSSTSQRTRRPSRSSSKTCRPTRTSSIFTACPSRSSTSRTLVAGAVSNRRPASRSPGGRPSTFSTSNSLVSLRTLSVTRLYTDTGRCPRNLREPGDPDKKFGDELSFYWGCPPRGVSAEGRLPGPRPRSRSLRPGDGRRHAQPRDAAAQPWASRSFELDQFTRPGRAALPSHWCRHL